MGFDVEDFNAQGGGGSGGFVRKEAIQAGGPRRVRIAAVEQRDGFKEKDGTSKPELVLVFSDGTKFGLRAWINRDAMKTAFGRDTDGWVGKVIELHVDASVRNPQGARVGGLRVRLPTSGAAPAEYTSDLEDDEDPADGPIPF